MRVSVLALAFAAGLAGAGAAAAQEYQPIQAGHVTLDVRATIVDPQAGSHILTTATPPADTGLRSDINSNAIPSLGIRYFFTDNISSELVLGTSRHSIHAVNSTTDLPVGRTWVLPPVATVQYSFNPHGRINPYVGAGVNYMLFYSGRSAPGFANTHVRNGFGWVLQAGADVALRGRWSMNLDLKKVFFRTTATTTLLPSTDLTTRVRMDPWVPSIGVGYRF